MGTNVIYTLQASFQQLWIETLQFLPLLFAAIVIVVAGAIAGAILRRITERVFQTLKVDEALAAAQLDVLVKRAGYTLRSGAFVGALVQWFVIIVFFVAALDILALDEVTIFFREVVLGYLPQVIVAVLILVVASVVANVAATSVRAAATAARISAASLLSAVTRYAILLFAVLAALNQLAIAPELVQTLFMGIVFAASLAFGLAFGLGGRDAARVYLESLMRRDTERG